MLTSVVVYVRLMDYQITKSSGNLRGACAQVRAFGRMIHVVAGCSLCAAIIGLQGFFPLKGTAAVGVGALEYPVAERKRLAALYVSMPAPPCRVRL